MGEKKNSIELFDPVVDVDKRIFFWEQTFFKGGLPRAVSVHSRPGLGSKQFSLNHYLMICEIIVKIRAPLKRQKYSYLPNPKIPLAPLERHNSLNFSKGFFALDTCLKLLLIISSSSRVNAFWILPAIIASTIGKQVHQRKLTLVIIWHGGSMLGSTLFSNDLKRSRY